MPVIIKPVKSEKFGDVNAIFEVINKKGVIGRTACQKVKVDLIDAEMLDHFIKLFSLALTKCSQFQRTIVNIRNGKEIIAPIDPGIYFQCNFYVLFRELFFNRYKHTSNN